MEGENFLSCIAQLGIAVAGFAGILTIFKKRSKEWLPNEFAGMKLIVAFSFGMTAISLTAFPIFFIYEENSFTWKVCSLILALFLAYEVIVQFRLKITLTKIGFGPRGAMRFNIVVLILPTILSILNFTNAFIGEFTIFGFGLLLMLFITMQQFSVFLISFQNIKPGNNE